MEAYAAYLSKTREATGFVLLARHDRKIGGNDPSELFFVASRGAWERQCLEQPGAAPKRLSSTARAGRQTLLSDGCMVADAACPKAIRFSQVCTAVPAGSNSEFQRLALFANFSGVTQFVRPLSAPHACRCWLEGRRCLDIRRFS
eukprot:SAG11_NODE_3240_length_2589_cov_1.687550_1_plen_145_part_00